MSGSASDYVSPNVYLNNALDLIEQHSVRREMLDWEALRSKALTIVAEAHTLQDTYPAIRFVLSQLGDRHSFLLGADKARAVSIAQRCGLGFRSVDGVIVRVYPTSPAFDAGIQPGDKIETIEGMRPTNWEDQNHTRIDFFKGERICLSLNREGDKQLTVALHSAQFQANLAPQGRLLTSGIGYIELPGTEGRGLLADGRRYAEVVQQHIRLLEQVYSVNKWIVDLRLNEGGNMWPMLAGVGPLLGKNAGTNSIAADGQILHRWRYTQGQIWLDDDLIEAVIPDYRLTTSQPSVAVLTSQLTASAGEGVVLAFRGSPNCHSFGQPTRGLTAGNQGFRLDDGAVLSLATAYGTDRIGRVYQGAIFPDTPVELDWCQFDTGTDPVLIAAVGWLASLNCS